MKTTFDAVDIIWKKLNAAFVVKKLISGGVYKYRRPFNSELEDIVINSLPLNVGMPDECVVNVNCYVPNIKISVQGTSNNDIPDTLRLKTLADLIIVQLIDNADDQHYYYVEFQSLLSNEAGNEFYSNIRLNFKFIPN